MTPTIYCKVKEHQGDLITHVCFNVGCKSFRPHCKRCNLSLHRDCHDHVKFLDDLTLQMNQIQEKNRQMLEIVTEDVKTLQKLERQLQLRSDIIEKYLEQSNLTNLNNLAGILESYENYDLNKLLEGQKQLSSHYIQNIVKEDDDLQNIEKFGKVKPQIANQIDTKQLNSQNNIQNTKVDPRLNTKIYTPSSRSETNNGNTQNNMGNQDKIDQANLCLEQGQSYYNKKEYANALESFELAIALDPNNNISYNKKGVTLNSLDRDFESIEYFDKALEIVNSKPLLDRESKFAYLRNKASALIKLDQFENSIKTINEGLALDPLNKHFIKLKYTSLLHFQRFDEALEFVNELIQLNSNDYKPHQMKVAGILIKFQKFQEAMDCFCLANSIKPKKGTYFLLGKLLEQLCRFDEAESCYQSALKLDQNYYQARQQLQIVQQYKEFI